MIPWYTLNSNPWDYRQGHFVLHATALACSLETVHLPDGEEANAIKEQNKLQVLRDAVLVGSYLHPCQATLRQISKPPVRVEAAQEQAAQQQLAAAAAQEQTQQAEQRQMADAAAQEQKAQQQMAQQQQTQTQQAWSTYHHQQDELPSDDQQQQQQQQQQYEASSDEIDRESG